jgi:hypothetical protein
MSIECGECEHDLRGGHADDCSRAPKRKRCRTVVSRSNLTPAERRDGIWLSRCKCGAQRVEEQS